MKRERKASPEMVAALEAWYEAVATNGESKKRLLVDNCRLWMEAFRIGYRAARRQGKKRRKP